MKRKHVKTDIYHGALDTCLFLRFSIKAFQIHYPLSFANYSRYRSCRWAEFPVVSLVVWQSDLCRKHELFFLHYIFIFRFFRVISNSFCLELYEVPRCTINIYLHVHLYIYVWHHTNVRPRLHVGFSQDS